MEYRLLVLVALVALAAVDVSGARKDKRKKSKKAMMGIEIEEIKENLTALWEKMDDMGPPVHVHMHGEGGIVGDHMHARDGTHVHIHLGDEPHSSHKNLQEEDGYFHAQCNLHPGSGSSDSVKGTIFLKQREGGPLMMKIALEGFDVSGPRPQHSHGFHLHKYGDLSRGCASLGGHFNPHGTTHGAMHGDDGSRHAGDWGNIRCNNEGIVEEYKVDNGTSLLGPHSIIGRGIVIHEGPDDMGMGGKPDSHKTGAAGGRLACCVITWHPMAEWEMGPVVEVEAVEGHSHHHGHHRHARDVHHLHDHAHHGHHDHHDHPGHHDHEHHDHDHHRHARDVHHLHDHAHHDHAHHGHHDHHDHPGHHVHEHHAQPGLSDFLHGSHWDHYLHGERHHHERRPKGRLPF